MRGRQPGRVLATVLVVPDQLPCIRHQGVGLLWALGVLHGLDQRRVLGQREFGPRYHRIGRTPRERFPVGEEIGAPRHNTARLRKEIAPLCVPK
jgi:hypothetical protein